MSKLRIRFYAEGWRHGCKVTLGEVCGNTYDDFIVDSFRWNTCHTPQEQEAVMLGVARVRYPEVDWESAHYVEIHQA